MGLALNLTASHVLVTGGSGFIGSATVDAFIAAGAKVTSLDLRASRDLPSSPNFRFFPCDVSSEGTLEKALATGAETFGPIACCIALARLDLSVLQHHESLADMDAEQRKRTHRGNVEGTFLTARTWLRALRDVARSAEHKSMANVSLMIVGSESGCFRERGNADYGSGKSAVHGGLLRSLIDNVARIWPGARVNAVAPGSVYTEQFKKKCKEDPEQFWKDCQAKNALKKPVPPESAAKSILILGSEN